jgi:hypothetical protein
MKTTRPMPRLAFFVPPTLEDYLSARHVAIDALIPLAERAVRDVAEETPPPPLGGIVATCLDRLTLVDGTSVEMDVVVTRRNPWFMYFVPHSQVPVDAMPVRESLSLKYWIHERPNGIVITTMARVEEARQAGRGELYGDTQDREHVQGSAGECAFAKWAGVRDELLRGLIGHA